MSDFLSKVNSDLNPAEPLPPGYRRATARETGLFYRPEDMHLNNRKIFRTFTNDAAGMAAWERSVSPEATYQRRFRDACANAVYDAKLDPYKGEGKALYQAYHTKSKPLPEKQQAELDAPETLPAELLAAVEARSNPHGVFNVNRMQNLSPASGEELLERMKRQQEDRRFSGIRLEKPPSIIKLER